MTINPADKREIDKEIQSHTSIGIDAVYSEGEDGEKR